MWKQGLPAPFHSAGLRLLVIIVVDVKIITRFFHLKFLMFFQEAAVFIVNTGWLFFTVND
jgi:hypothetical protein